MKHALISRKWKQMISVGLSLAMAVGLCSAMPVSAAPSEKEKAGKAAEVVSVKDKTPVTEDRKSTRLNSSHIH